MQAEIAHADEADEIERGQDPSGTQGYYEPLIKVMPTRHQRMQTHAPYS